MSNALVPVEQYAIVQQGIEQMTMVMQENLRGRMLSARDLTRVTTPAGSGAAMWTIPDPAGDQHVPTITGIIAHWHPRRTYYQYKPGENPSGDNRPQCSSPDGYTGYGFRFESDQKSNDKVHDCAECPLSKWNDATRTPPPCHERRSLYVLRQNDMIPLHLDLPRTAIMPYSEFMKELMKKMLVYYWAQVEIGLTKEKGQGRGQDYYRPTFKLVGEVPVAQRPGIQQYHGVVEQLVNAPVPSSTPGGPVLDQDGFTEEEL